MAQDILNDLDYLDFDHGEDADGNVTLDAMACVNVARWPALIGQVQRVLFWAQRHFPGQHAPLDEGGDWDFALQAHDDASGQALALHWDAQAARLDVMPLPSDTVRITLTLTLSGTSGFGQALRAAFAPGAA